MTSFDGETGHQDQATILDVRDLRKQYGHVEALRGANLAVRRREVLALVGDNGAGKSTLVKSISGAIRPSSGTIRFDGAEVEGLTIKSANALGISAVYQDLALAPDLSIAENMFLSTELHASGIRGLLGVRRRAEMRDRSAELIKNLGVNLPSMAIQVRDLSGGQRQVVAVARGVLRAAKMMILDEPTAALGPKQSAIVEDMLGAVRDKGITVLVISHDLPAVLKTADRIAVMRQGQVVAIVEATKTDINEIVRLMLGDVTQPNGRNNA